MRLQSCFRAILGAIAVLALANCLGAVDDGSSASSNDCNLPVGPKVPYSSAQDIAAAFTGKWVRCSDPGFVPPAHAGVEFTANNRWILLDRASDGSLVRRPPGVYNEGSVNVVPNGSGDYVVNLELDSGGTVIAFVVFTSGPTGVLINAQPYPKSRYVAAR